MSILSDKRIKEIEGQVFHESQPCGSGFELKVQRAIAEAAYRETLKMVRSKMRELPTEAVIEGTGIRVPGIPSLIISAKDWDILNKLEVSNGR